ncbi:hypothetical protein [uncultured Phenylobacterium sp.]|uniref:hypothetical protein n=1 Tax=uncultured Phenylobacterium sp. TaxID=349273 RepID=UPI0025F2313D|nr:hypothetical protein [uncultured Phenylobacterium sp.]
MDGWIGPALGIAALLIAAPLAAWVGHRHGRTIKRGTGLAFVMLGFGHVMDPPARHLVEAVGGEEEPPGPTGEPKDTPGGG